jgi:(S)-2-hydroxyglutarate dehydrogenase
MRVGWHGGWGMRSGSEIGIVGGGIVGLALARHLLATRPGVRVTVLEKESAVAQHQTGRNSGVVHAGLYYAPGSLKAQLCRRGVGLLKDYCSEHGLPYEELGKLVVARNADEAQRLATIGDRARENGVPGLTALGPDGIRAVEPAATGVAALHSPTTAVTDFGAVARQLAADVVAGGGEVLTGVEVLAIRQSTDEVSVLAGGLRYRFDALVVCAGLHSDRVAQMVGVTREPAIVPFRGEYSELAPARRHLVRGLVYPVPDPRFPFLGVHLTRHIGGRVSVGPNAVLAFSREGYRWRDISVRDLKDTLAWPGFWRLAGKYWRVGAGEMRASLTGRAFLAEARTFVPALTKGDLVRSSSGVRAQALDRQGRMVEDFVVEQCGRVALVRNAPSPAATSSLAIAEHVADRFRDLLPA